MSSTLEKTLCREALIFQMFSFRSAWFICTLCCIKLSLEQHFVFHGNPLKQSKQRKTGLSCSWRWTNLKADIPANIPLQRAMYMSNSVSCSSQICELSHLSTHFSCSNMPKNLIYFEFGQLIFVGFGSLPSGHLVGCFKSDETVFYGSRGVRNSARTVAWSEMRLLIG